MEAVSFALSAESHYKKTHRSEQAQENRDAIALLKGLLDREQVTHANSDLLFDDDMPRPQQRVGINIGRCNLYVQASVKDDRIVNDVVFLRSLTGRVLGTIPYKEADRYTIGQVVATNPLTDEEVVEYHKTRRR